MALESVFEYLRSNWRGLLLPAGTFVIVLLGGWLGRRLLFARLRRWAAGTKTHIDDLVVDSLHGPFLLWILILAVSLAARVSPLSPSVTVWTGKLLLALWIISLTLVFARMSSRLIQTYGDRLEGALPVGTLTQRLVSLLVGLLGLMALLNTFDISLVPVLTALGVGGLAVALALQDTLSNFFAGFYVSLARQIRIGDFVKLQSGEDGFVTDIGWRSTTLRSLSNNLVVIPNNKLAQTIVTNFYLPERRMAVLIHVGVSYDSDPDLVEKVLVDVALSAADEVRGLLKEPAPTARLIPGFGDNSLDFTLTCQVEEYMDQYLAQHELRKRILRRLRAEGIQIALPAGTVVSKRPQPGTFPA